MTDPFDCYDDGTLKVTVAGTSGEIYSGTATNDDDTDDEADDGDTYDLDLRNTSSGGKAIGFIQIDKE